MKMDPGLFLKWLDGKNTALKGADYHLPQLCVLVGMDTDGRAVGMTVCKQADFTEKFVERLHARRLRPESEKLRFTLYLPPALKDRSKAIVSEQVRTDLRLSVQFTPFVHIRHIGDHFVVRDKLRIVTVDDSPTILKFLKVAIQELGYMELAAQITDPMLAVHAIQEADPDLVTMDIQMPGRNGVQILKDLLKLKSYPVLMISGLNLDEGSLVFEALNSGAFDYIQKPRFDEKESFKEELGLKALLALERIGEHHAPALGAVPTRAKVHSQVTFSDTTLWCIGASTGGTQALTKVLESLPEKIPATLIVQHIPPVFSKAFAESLNKICPFEVSEAVDGEWVEQNHVYVAPGGTQMGIERELGRLKIVLRDAPPVNRFKPSVDYLFHDVAKLKGLHLVAGILTGMGRDGAQGLLALKKNGAATFAQDEATSVVYGMPRAAFEVGAVDKVVPLGTVAQTLLDLTAAPVRVALNRASGQ